jgi:trans-2,3-dihydro-3-hydroxyanthranilate isomerase
MTVSVAGLSRTGPLATGSGGRVRRMVSHPYVLTDVFTDRPLAGNQLAVFVDAHRMDESLLQPVAREMNLSETVFVFPPANGGTARVRYFTTVEELDFAGHPTLGTAVVLARRDFGDGAEVVVCLETRRAEVPVRVRRSAGAYTGWMTQPTPSVRPWDGGAALFAALGVAGSALPVEVYDNGICHLYVTLGSIAEVLAVEPDLAALGRTCGHVRVNVFAGAGATFTSRMFSPFDRAMPEDPACGSAAGPLAVHLLRHGVIGSGQEIVISQGECVGRPSTLRALADGDGEAIREVRVGGSAVVVGEGALELD